jgi:phospholipase/carboxylesterase
MNRIAAYAELIAQVRESSKTQSNRDSQEYPSSQDSATYYHLLGPELYEKNYAYPLVIWLHGPGGNERQLLPIMREISLRNYVAVAPRGTSSEANGEGYDWSNDDYSVDRARQAVRQCVRVACEKYNVNRARIFLAGLHSGGTLALRLALSEPEHFAGVASVGGTFPQGCRALLRYRAAQELPLLMLRGLESATYTEAIFCEELRLFHAGALKVHCRQYLAGDEPTVPMFKDLNGWLMEQITGMPILDKHDSAANSCGGS